MNLLVQDHRKYDRLVDVRSADKVANQTDNELRKVSLMRVAINVVGRLCLKAARLCDALWIGESLRAEDCNTPLHEGLERCSGFQRKKMFARSHCCYVCYRDRFSDITSRSQMA